MRRSLAPSQRGLAQNDENALEPRAPGQALLYNRNVSAVSSRIAAMRPL
jgi:hypothetical protein